MFFQIAAAFLLVHISSELKTVIILSHHGDRAPEGAFNKDPHGDESIWGVKWGELTKAGETRMRKLGEYWKKRYASLMAENPLVVAKSSSVGRCIKSLEATLSAFYSPKTPPISVDVPKPNFLLFVDTKECPNLMKAVTEGMKTFKVVKEIQKHAALYAKLYKYTGTDLTNGAGLHKAIETMLLQKANNLSQPEWFNDKAIAEVEELLNLMFYHAFKTKASQRLEAGLLFKQIKDILLSTKDQKQKTLFFFSTDDTKLGTVLNALKVFDKKVPPFGSSVMLEVERKANGLVLQAFYLKDTSSEKPIELSFSFCNNAKECPLDNFINYVDKFAVQDWNKECKET